MKALLIARARLAVTALFGTWVLFSSPWLWADPATPPSMVIEAAPALKKIGEGRFTWWGLHVYDGQLWASEPSAEFNYLKHPHWLQLKYGRDFDGRDIAKRSREEIEEQGQVDANLLPEWEAEMSRIFPNVSEDDTLSAFFRPDEPAQIFHNRLRVGTFSSLELSKAFMAIWLDERTSEPDLRAKLLGNP